MLRNLPARHSAEAAIAASHLLPSLPAAQQVLLRPAAVPTLIAAFLEEHSQPEVDSLVGECNDGPYLIDHCNRGRESNVRILAVFRD